MPDEMRKKVHHYIRTMKGIVMDVQPDFERLKKTMRHVEPDRLPLIEVLVAYEIQSQFLERKVKDSDLKSQVEFWVKGGYDAIPLTVGMMSPGEVTKASSIYRVVQKTLRKEEDEVVPWNIEENGVISNPEDFDRFPWEEAAKLDFSKFYDIQPFLPQGMKVLACSGKVFTVTWMLMGFQNFCLSLYMQEELVSKVFHKVGEIQLQGAKELSKIPNIGALWLVDDLSYGSGPLIDPKFFRKYVFPWYEEVGALAKKQGLLFFFHSDGNIWPIMDDLVSIRFDAIHPIDPTSMDIREVKRKVGKKLGIMGNIHTDLLSRGTPEEVREITKKAIRDIAPGGGYALGSGNSVPNWVRFENYQAMRETVLTYGTYPIKI
ncbi:MAG: uroporphyrinogen decarboxylase family protein [Thermodesulfobacteriota bacterium]|jgi:uroporphyrinogen decarboxylase